MQSVTLCRGLESGLTNTRISKPFNDGNLSLSTSCHGLLKVSPVRGGPEASSRRELSLRKPVARRVIRGDECSRRFPYKRRSPPTKSFPVTHESESEAHKIQLERQKARAFDFFYGEDASTSDRFNFQHEKTSDEYWSARSLTQVGLILRSLEYSSIRLDYWLASLHPRRKGRAGRRSLRESRGLQELIKLDAQFRTNRDGRPSTFQDFEEDDDYSCYGKSRQARPVAVTFDSRQRMMTDDSSWENDSPSQTEVDRAAKKLRKLLSRAAHKFGNLDIVQWLDRLKQTYGTSFMVLVVLGYCTQGFRCFPWLAIAYFYKDNLQVDPGTMQFLISTASLPMVAKPIYGIVSDSIYIGGAHRLPYLILAGALQVVSWGAIVIHPGASSSIVVLTGVLTLSNMGAAISEVMNDALVAEAGKNKKGAHQGELQSLAWLALASGGLLGNLTGGFALQRMETTTMFSIFMMLLGAQLLVCLSISEGSFGLGHSQESKSVHGAITHQREEALLLPQKTKRIFSRMGYPSADVLLEGISRVTSRARRVTTEGQLTSEFHYPDKAKLRPLGMRQQILMLSELLQKPEVFQPLLWFLSSYAVIPGLGSSMFFYQTQHLGLDSSVVGLAKVVGQMGLLAGSIFYNRNLKKVPLRKLFGGIQILLSLCMLSDILLVNRVNLQLGIPDEYFVLGASAFVEAIAQFKILPFMVLLAQLCPSGSEGSLFAFFMSAQCLAGTMSAYLGVGLASYLHISSSSFDELPLGIFVQASFALLPVLWINLIPEQTEPSPSLQQEEKVR